MKSTTTTTTTTTPRHVTFNVEFTDTFGGEANYSWVKRHTLTVPESTSNRAIARRAKALVGLNGVRGRAWWHGDQYEFRPFGYCAVLFVTFQY